MISRLKTKRAYIIVASLLLLSWAAETTAAVVGIEGAVGTGGPEFALVAREGYITTGEGNQVYMWGYAEGNDAMQHPGPTLIVDEGDVVTVLLRSELPNGTRTSIVFPGHVVEASGGTTGLMVQEAAPLIPGIGGNPGQAAIDVTYTFTATHPGTYLYNSGTDAALQNEMGLFGALIVRPSTNPTSQAYNLLGTEFDQEYLFILSEIDDHIHNLVENGQIAEVNMNERVPVYWLINGRTGVDTLFGDNVPYLPTQPYSALALSCPWDVTLVRYVGAGLDVHPFHPHGQNFRMIARDGRPLVSPGGTHANVGPSDYTLTASPGQTYDTTWQWTGEALGWDIYGHSNTDPMEPGEDVNDHGKPLPVLLPENLFLAFGGFYSGSPFLGSEGELPVGEGGLNPNSAFFQIWHSHAEIELANFDVFPGGMLTMMAILPPSHAFCQ
ncbi:MAG: multicopper oxidase domain-containing protein [bacterium]|nr:multicopper oxidase domain-containing protein [bacterium]